MKEIITQRVEQLRIWMRKQGLCAYIFPSTDPHMGEYVPDHWKAREWISGFNGSAGTAVVTLTRAALWTDSRYWLAAEEQTAGTPFDVIRCGSNQVTEQDVVAWLAGAPEQAPNSEAPVLGLNAWTMPTDYAETLEQQLLQRGWLMRGCVTPEDEDPESLLWTERPPLPLSAIEIQPLELAGKSATAKLQEIRASLSEADTLVVTQLDEIAWALNLRGSDVHCTPVFVSYLVIQPEEAVLYVNPAQLTAEVSTYLHDIHVSIRPYTDIVKDLYESRIDSHIGIQFDPSVTNLALATAIRHEGGGRPFYEYSSPIPLLRAVKDEAEIVGFRHAMLKDGIAMVKFMRWLSTGKWTMDNGQWTMNGEPVTEITIDRKLTALRAEQPGFRGLSFDTIAAYGPHAAIVHYEATPDTDIPLEPHGLLLLDSGAQYQDGTTDITRTIALGPLTDEERLDYTLVLKGHIRLATAVFPKGTTGTQLDVLARYAMWQHHKNYGHGTGHGVGSFLSVHEGPHQFRMNYVPTPLQAGMTVTIEPGIYIAGSHGVRIENTMLITDSPPSAPYLTGGMPDGQGGSSWLRLEPLTLCPIDTTPILRELLLPDEIDYLNKYHAHVRKALLPLLTDEADRQWLIAHTASIKTKN